MDDKEVVRLVGQYLHEHGFTNTLRELEEESGRQFNKSSEKTGELQAILDEHAVRLEREREAAHDVATLFHTGKGEYVDQLWCSLDTLTGGVNALTVRMTENGDIAVGASKAMVVTTQINVPLLRDPPLSPISNTHIFCKGAVLSIDFHPKQRNMLLCGSMDMCSMILDLSLTDNPLIQKFQDHRKYVVRVLWSPSGECFVSGSYDKFVCIYKLRHKDEPESSPLYQLAKKIEFIGAVEAVAMSTSTEECVVGIRNDYLLHVIDMSGDTPVETRQVNLNAFGDNHVSFTAMHVTFSPCGSFILVSTDRDRLIMYSWSTGKQITVFYGSTNDEYSQPRHCWDPSGNYIYGTSQDKSICVWEIRSQKIVCRLQGHTGTVRDIHFSKELGLLTSCGFDGTVKLWKKIDKE